VRFVEQSLIDITVDRALLTRRARAEAPVLGRSWSPLGTAQARRVIIYVN